MGRVYLAEHVDLGRRCAVKVMRPEIMQDTGARARFKREAQSASRIAHANVATVYDFGEASDGTVFLAMELVSGGSLTALVEREGPLPVARAAAIVREIAAGLEAAHQLVIVHRDMKPDNVMLAAHPDGRDCAKIVDFGIAKAKHVDTHTLTPNGAVIGTPDYIAPEQLRGAAADPRADIYALGLVAFNMLTGKLAFPGEDALGRMYMRMTEAPLTLAAAKPDTVWPPALQSVFSRVLHRDPDKRFQSALAFAHDLSAAVVRPGWWPWEVTTGALRRILGQLPARPARRSATSWRPLARIGALILVATGAGTAAALLSDGGDGAAGSVQSETPRNTPGESDSLPVGSLTPPPDRSGATPSVPEERLPPPKDSDRPTNLPPNGVDPSIDAPARPPTDRSPRSDSRRLLDQVNDRVAAAKSRGPAGRAEARAVLDAVPALLSRLDTRRDTVELGMYATAAYLLLGERRDACLMFGAIRDDAADIPHLVPQVRLWNRELSCAGVGDPGGTP
jgi:serine/threonine-protein kinase